MQLPAVPLGLRAKLGAEGSKELTDMFGQYHLIVTDSFERRLVQEVSGLRVEFERGLAGIRVEMERTRSDLIKWNLLFWIGQFTAVVTLLPYLLNG